MNKKVVVLIVLLECIFAIFLVSFFGRIIEESRRDVLVQQIYFTDANGTKIEDDKAIVIEVDQTTKRDYQLYWVILPEDATNREVEIISSNENVAKYAGGGRITFFEWETVEITIRTKDDSPCEDTITIIPQKSSESDAEI